MTYVRGTKLTAEQRQIALALFPNRRQPDDAWLATHKFAITRDGRLISRRRPRPA